MRWHAPRMTVKMWMIVVAVVAVVVFVANALSFEVAWDGRGFVPLEFSIIDRANEAPIEGAIIRLDRDRDGYEAKTGARGDAGIMIDTRTAGRSSWIRKTQVIDYGWTLEVSAQGYTGVVMDLRELTRAPAYHARRARRPVIVVRLGRSAP